jgi:hypothetical protein
MVLREFLERGQPTMRCCTKHPTDGSNLEKRMKLGGLPGFSSWFMTRNVSGLILWLEQGQFTLAGKIFRMVYHSFTRFAMSRRGLEALTPFSDTASSKINLSSSGGRYRPEMVLMADI